MAYEVKLDVFAGPIDLLLQLITRQRVDIYDISIATITDEYLRAVGSLERMDLESATGFLVVAATLLELKSARLLPGRSADADDNLLEERDLLLARLVECATYRDAGRHIQAQLEAGADLHGRVALEEPYASLGPDLLARLTLDHLVAAAADALVQPPPVVLDTSHVAPIQASVRDAIVEVAVRLESRSTAPFTELCRPGLNRIEVVVRFLAILELFKAGAIDIAQADRFGDIVASWTGEIDVAEVLADADEYVVTGEGT
jgi:segregation and condensation protein A